MIGRVLLSCLALVSVAAKAAPEPAPKPAMLSVIAPQEVASDPSNRLTLELSTGGKVVIMLRPDAAPNPARRPVPAPLSRPVVRGSNAPALRDCRAVAHGSRVERLPATPAIPPV